MDCAVPFPLIAGLVNNEAEAAALVQLDVLSLQSEVIQEHLAATACYNCALRDATAGLAREAGPASTNTALALLLGGMRGLQEGTTVLRSRAAEVAGRMQEVEAKLHFYAERNQGLAADLQQEAGCGAVVAVVAKKRRLWLVEEGLCHRIKQQRDGFH